MASKEVVQWCHLDAAPGFIARGEYAGRGMLDGMAGSLKKGLPDYEHRNVSANFRRLAEMLRAGDQMLCLGVLPTQERQSYMAFSIPHAVIRPFVALVPRQDLPLFRPYLNGRGELQLKRILTESTLNLGLPSGRSYGKEIDEVLAQVQPRSNVILRSANNDIQLALVQMMFLGRINYTLSYPMELRYISRVLNKEDEVAALPIEGLPAYYTMHVVAPNNPWGQQMIRKINTVIRNNLDQSEYFRNYDYWLDDETRGWSRRQLKQLLRN